MNPFIMFLQQLGFTEVRQTKSDVVELYVAETMKAAKKKLRAKNIRFLLHSHNSTANATINHYYAVEQRKVIGSVTLTSYATHSIVKLTNLEA